MQRVLGMLLALGLGAVLTGAPMAMAQEAEGVSPGYVTVVGNGEIRTTPDMATVTLGVEMQENTAVQASRAASDRIVKILAVLTQAGVAREDVQTTGLSLNPVYERERNDVSRPPRLLGFMAQNTLQVTVRNMDLLGPLLDQVIAQGANTFRGLSFGLQDPVLAQDAARRDAVADALGKATLLAEAAGARRGAILSITESGAQGPQPQYSARFAMSEASSVAVAPGALSVSEQVTIVFALEQ